jgi:excisionase family DNA binding protein
MNGGAGKDLGRSRRAKAARQHGQDTEVAGSQPLLDYEAAAAYLGANPSFLRRLVLERRVRYYKVGKFVRFRAVDLDAFINEGRVEPREVRVR